MPSKRYVNVRQAVAIEELATRLAALEAAVARIEEKLDKLATVKKPAAEK